MSAEQTRPGRISRKGLFLWQEDSPSGAGMNLWSGLLSANNGYSEEHALKAAVLFEAAPELFAACQRIVALTASYPLLAAELDIPLVEAAIAKATGQQGGAA